MKKKSENISPIGSMSATRESKIKPFKIYNQSTRKLSLFFRELITSWIVEPEKKETLPFGYPNTSQKMLKLLSPLMASHNQ